MEINELKIVNHVYGYKFQICRVENGYNIISFNYYQWGLNLSSDKTYKTISSCICAGKNILNNHFKKPLFK